MVEMEGDLYVIGGFDGETVQNSIHRLRCSSGICRWTTMKQELQVSRSYPIAILLTEMLLIVIKLIMTLIENTYFLSRWMVSSYFMNSISLFSNKAFIQNTYL